MIPGVNLESLVYLNGEIVRLAEAKISVLDRGFIFGDGVYYVAMIFYDLAFSMIEVIAL